MAGMLVRDRHALAEGPVLLGPLVPEERESIPAVPVAAELRVLDDLTLVSDLSGSTAP